MRARGYRAQRKQRVTDQGSQTPADPGTLLPPSGPNTSSVLEEPVAEVAKNAGSVPGAARPSTRRAMSKPGDEQIVERQRRFARCDRCGGSGSHLAPWR